MHPHGSSSKNSSNINSTSTRGTAKACIPVEMSEQRCADRLHSSVPTVLSVGALVFIVLSAASISIARFILIITLLGALALLLLVLIFIPFHPPLPLRRQPRRLLLVIFIATAVATTVATPPQHRAEQLRLRQPRTERVLAVGHLRPVPVVLVVLRSKQHSEIQNACRLDFDV